jgi:hypothetical protein
MNVKGLKQFSEVTTMQNRTAKVALRSFQQKPDTFNQNPVSTIAGPISFGGV